MGKSSSPGGSGQENKIDTKKLRPALRVELARCRKNADEYAASILRSGTFVTDDHVLQALTLWKFNKNKRRSNVFPDGASFVFSDTFGLTRAKRNIRIATSTDRFPHVFALLARWLSIRQPVSSLGRAFSWTSINVNFGYRALSSITRIDICKC